jgi:hypothetical protein
MLKLIFNTLIKPVLYAHIRASVAYANIPGSPWSEDNRKLSDKIIEKLCQVIATENGGYI